MNMDLITLEEATQMSQTKIECEIGKKKRALEALGLSEEDASRFIASVISLGVAANNKKENL